MFPDECENCGLKTEELIDLEKPDGFIYWFICKHCEGKLYQHEYVPHDTYHGLCKYCGKTLCSDNHC